MRFEEPARALETDLCWDPLGRPAEPSQRRLVPTGASHTFKLRSLLVFNQLQLGLDQSSLIDPGNESSFFWLCSLKFSLFFFFFF